MLPEILFCWRRGRKETTQIHHRSIIYIYIYSIYIFHHRFPTVDSSNGSKWWMSLYIDKWIQINGYDIKIYIYRYSYSTYIYIYIIIYKKINEHRPSSSANPGRKTSAKLIPPRRKPGCRGSRRSRKWCLPVCKAPGMGYPLGSVKPSKIKALKLGED